MGGRRRRPRGAPETAGDAELRRALAEAALLNAIAVAASGEEDLGQILAAALGRLGHLVGFTGGSIALIEGDDLVIRAAVGAGYSAGMKPSCFSIVARSQ